LFGAAVCKFDISLPTVHVYDGVCADGGGDCANDDGGGGDVSADTYRGCRYSASGSASVSDDGSTSGGGASVNDDDDDDDDDTSGGSGGSKSESTIESMIDTFLYKFILIKIIQRRSRQPRARTHEITFVAARWRQRSSCGATSTTRFATT